MEKLLKELREEAKSNNLLSLSIEDAKLLKGKRIQTIYFGYANQDGVDDFIVGDVISEYDLAKKDGSCKTHKNRAEYWESYMTTAQLKTKKETFQLLRADGTKTYIYSSKLFGEQQLFSCSDDDRNIKYRIVGEN